MGNTAEAAQQGADVAGLASGLSEARLAFSRYQLNHASDDAERAKTLLAGLGGDSAIAGQVTDYSGIVDQMTALDGDIADLSAAMDESGLATTDTLGGLIAEAAQSASLNAKAAAVSGLAMQQALEVRLAVDVLLSEPADNSLAAVNDRIGQAQATLAELRGIFFKADDVGRVDAVTARLAEYAGMIGQVHARMLDRQALAQQAATIDTAIATSFAELAATAQAQQADLETAADRQAGAISPGGLIAGLVTLVARNCLGRDHCPLAIGLDPGIGGGDGPHG
ncbi:hypothetical protein N8D56_03860 [Devosia sp. A8/3-2]|nr:hypothetical protein N8D56_03860 [Devosia sp. A8/3-2]